MGVIGEPRSVWLRRRSLDLNEYKDRAPSVSDCSLEIDESTIVYDEETGQLVLVHLLLDDPCEDIQSALSMIHFNKYFRNNGLETYSRIFGNSPRALPRRDFCNITSLSRESPKEHEIIAGYSNRVSTYYHQFNPERFRNHAKMTTKVLDEWRLQDSVFTSGIINKNNPLHYHFDSGNFQRVWSNMLVFRQGGALGGSLVCPEYDVRFALPNNSLMMFDGQDVLHGVTPIGLQTPDAARYSIVFYSLKQMWNCLPLNDEIIRAQKRRTEREYRRQAAKSADATKAEVVDA